MKEIKGQRWEAALKGSWHAVHSMRRSTANDKLQPTQTAMDDEPSSTRKKETKLSVFKLLCFLLLRHALLEHFEPHKWEDDKCHQKEE